MPARTEIVSSGLDESIFTLPDGFQRPRWLRKGERKHIPERTWTWEHVLEKSKGRESDSWYDPRLALERIETVEMETVRDAFELVDKRKPHLRVYARSIGEVIGASKGKPTEYVCVWYSQDGGVHGFPIPHEQLKRKLSKHETN